jgi:hypothetical protein
VAALSGWIALFLMGYILAALFYVEAGTKRALKLTAAHGDLQSEAQNALGGGYRSRFLWLKRHRSRLPSEAQPIAVRVVNVELSCWVAIVILFVLYGMQFVAL